MSKKSKDDFIDEEEFLSTVSMNKKGGCVKMGKPPQEIVQEESPHSEEPQERTENKKTERKRNQDNTLVRLRASKENVQRMSAYIRIDNHKRFSVAAGVYKTTIGQMVDAILDEWWEKNRDEVKSLYYQGREVFEDEQ